MERLRDSRSAGREKSRAYDSQPSGMPARVFPSPQPSSRTFDPSGRAGMPTTFPPQSLPLPAYSLSQAFMHVSKSTKEDKQMEANKTAGQKGHYSCQG